VSDEILLKSTADGTRLALAGAGEWTALAANRLEKDIAATGRGAGDITRVDIDMSAVKRLDTFGAWLLERLVRSWRDRGAVTQVSGLAPDFQTLIEEMRGAGQKAAPPAPRIGLVSEGVSAIGRSVVTAGGAFIAILDMLGALGVTLARVVVRPARFRFTSLVHHLDHVCWRAVPIILLITFLIGAIIAQQGIFHFRKFGADIYVVDMVGILVLREIGVLIVAIMVAGRSGSAYTAEIGSMKMREEVDALRTMGFDPVEVLILPRVLALIIALPILTFVGSMAALYGGGLVCWLYGGIDPDIFLSRLKEAITLDHFKVGMIKAPFMALIIGIVASVAGLKVKGSAESLGMQTTASVVESIFLVIVVDGLFAMFFASIGM
jgi:phospholipid/cholesterol/gamma-HCH transport system permease protein